MKAIVYRHYGSPDMLHLEEVAKPAFKQDEVLVKVRASSINAADWLFLKGEPLMVRLMAGGLQKPRKIILGVDIAGVVEAVGSQVTQLRPGDEVYGDISSCGMGGFAEFVAVPEKFLALKPVHLSFEAAATVPLAGMTALQGLRDKGNVSDPIWWRG